MRMRRGMVQVVGVLALVALGCSSNGGSEPATTGAPADAGTEATAPPPPDTSGEVLLLSYNVAGLPQGISSSNPEANLPLIAPLLNEYDLVLTQEDFDWWHPDIDALDFTNYHTRLRADATHEYRSERHPGYEAVGIDREADRPELFVGDGLGLLSRLPIGEVERIPWVDCFGGADTSLGGAGDCLSMKGFMITTVELAPGVEAVLVNLHAEAGSTDADVRASISGYEQLAEYLNEHAADKAIIMAGDMNLHTGPDREPKVAEDGTVFPSDREIWLEFLEETGITDACDLIECENPGRIDKAAFRNSDTLEFAVTYHHFEVEKFVDPAGEPLSDHDALAVRFTWEFVG